MEASLSQLQTASSAADRPPLELLPSPDTDPNGGSVDVFLAHGAVEVPGAQKLVDYSLNVPEVLDSPIIDVIVPGFGGVKRSSDGFRDALASQGHTATLSFEPARSGGRIKDLLNPQKVHIDTLTAILQDLPNNPQLEEILGGRHLDFNQVVLIMHSMGTLAGTERARLYPDETKAAIYIGGIGLEGRKVGLGFIPRLAESTSHDVAGKYVSGKLVPGTNRLDLAFRTGRYYLCNPQRTIGEIATCLTADLQKPLRLLKILGVPTAALLFSAEKLVPAKQKTLDVINELVDLCEVMEGYGHLAPQRHPEDVATRIGSISRQLADLRQPQVLAA